MCQVLATMNSNRMMAIGSEPRIWAALIGGFSLTVLLWIAAYAIGGGR